MPILPILAVLGVGYLIWRSRQRPVQAASTSKPVWNYWAAFGGTWTDGKPFYDAWVQDPNGQMTMVNEPSSTGASAEKVVHYTSELAAEQQASRYIENHGGTPVKSSGFPK